MEHPPFIKLVEGQGNLPKLAITTNHNTSVDVCLHGAHITSYTVNDKELLFMSEKSVFKPPKAIRGGIPICWPQFGPGALQQHGFARNSTWTWVGVNVVEDGKEVEAILELSSSEETMKIWPYEFKLALTIILKANNDLRVELRVENCGQDSFTFTTALHNYFNVSDIHTVSVEGLKGVSYVDRMEEGQEFNEERAAVTFDREIDRNYVDTPAELAVVHADGRTMLTKSGNLPDAVVWNPWVAKAKAMGDFGDDEYQKMVCVEAGAVGTPNTEVISPGGVWKAWQQISFQSSK